MYCLHDQANSPSQHDRANTHEASLLSARIVPYTWYWKHSWRWWKVKQVIVHDVY